MGDDDLREDGAKAVFQDEQADAPAIIQDKHRRNSRHSELERKRMKSKQMRRD
jgi:hypothetical protein